MKEYYLMNIYLISKISHLMSLLQKNKKPQCRLEFIIEMIKHENVNLF